MLIKDEILRILISEGKNPDAVIDFFLKNDPDRINALNSNNKELLRKLLSLDPGYSVEKNETGKNFSWILSLWKKNDPDLLKILTSGPNNSLQKQFLNAQSLFEKDFFKKQIGISDINKFKSVKDFLNILSKAFLKNRELLPEHKSNLEIINQDIRDGIIAKTNLSNKNYLVVKVLKKKGACKYGNVHKPVDNLWCTAKSQDNAFDSYKEGDLYIFIDKNDKLKSKYQLYVNGKQNITFLDDLNKSFDYKKFFDKNIDIFGKLFPEFIDAILNKKRLEIDTTNLLKYLPTKYLNLYRKSIHKFTSSFLKALKSCSDGKINPELFFDEENIGFNYDKLEFSRKGIEIECNFDDFEGLYSFVNVVDGGDFNSYDEFNRDEFDYLQNYIPEEKVKDLVELVRMFDGDFSEKLFHEEGKLYEIISSEPAIKFFEGLLDTFSSEYLDAKERGATDSIKEAMGSLPFSFGYNYIFIEYGKLYDYSIENNLIDFNTLYALIKKILYRNNITSDSFYEYGDNNFDSTEMKKELSKEIDNIKEKIEDNPEQFQEGIKNLDLYDRLKRELNIHDYRYGKGTDQIVDAIDNNIVRILIGEKNLLKGNLKVKILDKVNKNEHEGWIKLNDLVKYATMPLMFESKNKNLKYLYKNTETMNIKKSDLQQIIKEEAIRLFQIQKLEEAKKTVVDNLQLISEGKEKITNEELNNLMTGLKGVLAIKPENKVGPAIKDDQKNTLLKRKEEILAEIKKLA